MPYKIFKIAKILNISTGEIFKILSKNNFKIINKPTNKISDEAVEFLEHKYNINIRNTSNLKNFLEIIMENDDSVDEFSYKEKDENKKLDINLNINEVDIKVENENISFDETKHFSNIPIFDDDYETNEERDYSSKNIQSESTRRIGHQKFSKIVKSNYNYSCAICGISEPEFLIAGHISTWAEDENNRLNPKNGICFCSLHDKAFEYGYIGLSNDYKVILKFQNKQGF